MKKNHLKFLKLIAKKLLYLLTKTIIKNAIFAFKIYE